ncbi:MAG: hypothetical protein Ct9H90mP27_4980 [Gammaproteobacteria bacterium]|nr:MAG: hypothetical protein Ct9H90mP27_4980 [Gammaproteobacteria bacterium]
MVLFMARAKPLFTQGKRGNPKKGKKKGIESAAPN